MLHERLEKLIKILGVKKGDFAERIGFSQSYISMILGQNKKNPSDRFYEAVSREFQVNQDWLRFGVGNMFTMPETHLSPTDSDLLHKYKSLPLSEQRVLEEKIDAMLVKKARP